MGKLELKLYGEKPGRKCIKLLTVVLDRMMFPVLQCWFFPERPVIILKGKKKNHVSFCIISFNCERWSSLSGFDLLGLLWCHVGINGVMK